MMDFTLMILGAAWALQELVMTVYVRNGISHRYLAIQTVPPSPSKCKDSSKDPTVITGMCFLPRPLASSATLATQQHRSCHGPHWSSTKAANAT